MISFVTSDPPIVMVMRSLTWISLWGMKICVPARVLRSVTTPDEVFADPVPFLTLSGKSGVMSSSLPDVMSVHEYDAVRIAPL